MASKSNKPALLVNGKRRDGRGPEDLRPITMRAGVLDNADGSAYIEWGNNRVLAAVYGPREVVPKHFADPSGAVIRCRYSMSPFASLEGHGRTGPNRRSTEISKVIKDVFENVVLLNEFPNSEIDIYMEVLQGDGSTRTTCVNAAAVALASAGIPMKDMVYGISIGKIEDKLCLDVDMIEDNYSDADMPIVISPRNDEILLLQMDGNLTKEEVNRALELGKAAGEKIKKLQRDAIVGMYEGV